jgi:hypothetical protein
MIYVVHVFFFYHMNIYFHQVARLTLSGSLSLPSLSPFKATGEERCRGACDSHVHVLASLGALATQQVVLVLARQGVLVLVGCWVLAEGACRCSFTQVLA